MFSWCVRVSKVGVRAARLVAQGLISGCAEVFAQVCHERTGCYNVPCLLPMITAMHNSAAPEGEVQHPICLPEAAYFESTPAKNCLIRELLGTQYGPQIAGHGQSYDKLREKLIPRWTEYTRHLADITIEPYYTASTALHKSEFGRIRPWFDVSTWSLSGVSVTLSDCPWRKKIFKTAVTGLPGSGKTTVLRCLSQNRPMLELDDTDSTASRFKVKAELTGNAGAYPKFIPFVTGNCVPCG